ncbi:hypothetical protein [Methanoregula sp.]|uniref:hypothetical protein n=1 Tax=Methanoregula sp. TaxID=2052170 RepID=UPI00261F5762|nr:hypothetical protein [Methanoregula sp.]MDD5143079.1 hypothetical protein [Methanoregula sp.]
MDKVIKIVIAVLALVVVASAALIFTSTVALNDSGIRATDTIYFFYGEECVYCHNVIPFVQNMSRKYPDADIRILEVWHNQTNYALYQKANIAAGVKYASVPQVIIGKVVLTGEPEIPERFEGLIQEYLKKKT